MTLQNQPTSLWIRQFHPGAASVSGAPTQRVRLVCFPHAGGSASYYHPVSARFADQAEVVVLQYPGRQDRRREPCIDDLNVLADRVTTELSALSPAPTLFFGHSMGATVAFEVARRQEEAGSGAPRVVIVSGRRAPSTRRPERVHEYDDEGLIAEVRKLNAAEAAVLEDEDIRAMALPAIRGDYRAIESYRGQPGRRIRAAVTVLTGDADPMTTYAEAQAWREHTDGEFRLRVFPGGHFFLAEQQDGVNQEIATDIARVHSTTGPPTT